jgi:hypothetical protein
MSIINNDSTIPELPFTSILSLSDLVILINEGETRQATLEQLDSIGYQGTDLKLLSSNWQDTFNTFQSLSSNWQDTFNITQSLSSNSENTFTAFTALSSNWQNTFNTVHSLSSNWQDTFNTVHSLSSNWQDTFNTVHSLSSNWQDTFNITQSLSSNWQDTFNITQSLSSNWQDTFNTFQTISSNSENSFNIINTLSSDWSAGSALKDLSANWQNTFTIVQSNSSNWNLGLMESFIIACGDETSNLVAMAPVISFRMPYGLILSEIKASVNSPPIGQPIIMDVNLNGTSIFSTRLSIDIAQTTSKTSTTPPIIATSVLPDDSVITIDIDQIGIGLTPGTGLKVTFKGYRTP